MSQADERVRPRHRLRLALACLLIVLGCVLAPVAVAAAWADDEVVDADRFVATLAPLSSNAAVQDAVADRVAQATVAAVDTPGLLDALRQALGGGLGDGSDPIGDLVAGAADAAAHAVVASDIFPPIWTDAVRIAHASALDALRGEEGGALTDENGEVVLDLGPVVDRVRQSLVDEGLPVAAAIPDTDRRFVLLHGAGLRESRDVFRFVDAAGTWLPIVVVALLVAGVCVAPRRRPALMWTGVGIVVGMLALGVAQHLARRAYLDDLPADVPRDAAAAIYDALVRFLRHTTRTVGVAALALAVAAFLAGPARSAGTVRHGLAAGPDAAGRSIARAGLGTGSVGRFVAAHRGPVYGAVGVLGGVWLVWWNHPTVSSVLLILLVLLGVLAVLETIAAAGAAVPADAAR
ncbi:hypothetical protein [Embleya sp. NBC_00896]|uniref:hypothetical protein n=1 Tax=Embleya sp. NBC_00896 TaxID=2975961 RepID=UPI0038645C9E|nr:hypothetical protein OG928_10085 [Embleya sp. NBC_00896]